MNPKEIVLFVLMALVVFAGVFGITKVKSWYEASQQNAQRGQVLETTGGMIDDGEVADTKRDTVDTGLGVAREDYQKQYQEDKRHEPEVASRAARVVPQRVRDNFRARRLARERLGCAGEQCQERSETETTSER